MKRYKNKATGKIYYENQPMIHRFSENNVWGGTPTVEQLTEWGYEEVIDPAPMPYVPTYEELVVQKIRQRYTVDDELAIQRQRDTKPEEFAEYFAYCEVCKRQAKEEEESA